MPLNENKTRITKLTKGFIFLKRFFKNHERIVVKLKKKNFHKMKRKLKSLIIKFNRKTEYIEQL